MKISRVKLVGEEQSQIEWDLEPELRYKVPQKADGDKRFLAVYGRAVDGQEYALQIIYPNMGALKDSLNRILKIINDWENSIHNGVEYDET